MLISPTPTTEFTVQPMDTFAAVGEYACLNCDYPEHFVEQWKSGVSAATDVCEDCEVVAGNLCFNNVAEAEFGTYECFVPKGLGESASCSAELIRAGECLHACVYLFMCMLKCVHVHVHVYICMCLCVWCVHTCMCVQKNSLDVSIMLLPGAVHSE